MSRFVVSLSARRVAASSSMRLGLGERMDVEQTGGAAVAISQRTNSAGEIVASIRSSVTIG